MNVGALTETLSQISYLSSVPQLFRWYMRGTWDLSGNHEHEFAL